MDLKPVCLFLALQVSCGINLESSSSVFARKYRWPWFPIRPDLLEKGAKFAHPLGAGCDQSKRPKGSLLTTLLEAHTEPAQKFNVDGWSGFCQLNWPLCNDARLNKDYSIYAKGLGPDWVAFSGEVDKYYCANNGWLEPEISSIVRNFTALQAKGKDLCATKYAGDFQDTVAAWGLLKFIEDVTTPTGSWKAAAWNCALGDVSCDMAYCNYAYCKQPDGRIGTMQECKGWDKVKGMPRTK